MSVRGYKEKWGPSWRSGWRREVKALREHWPQSTGAQGPGWAEELLGMQCSDGDGCQPSVLGQYGKRLARAAPWLSAEST